MSKLLTIGMATYDDFDGVYFTTQALRMYHDILKNIDYEILIIDNNPDGKHGQSVKNMVGWMHGNCKYIPYNSKTSTAIRDEIFRNSSSKYTVSIDCHVFIKNGGLDALLHYYENNPDCKDIIQGPMIYDDQTSYSTQFDPIWRGDMFGVWGTNKQAYDTGGGKAICLPKLEWLHRFNRPEGVKYRLVLEDRIWNYFIGWLEITRDPNDIMVLSIYNYFRNRIPKESLDNIFNDAKKLILGDNYANS